MYFKTCALFLQLKVCIPTVLLEKIRKILLVIINFKFLSYICSEILRVIDSLQLTATKKVATPADWKVSCEGQQSLDLQIVTYISVWRVHVNLHSYISYSCNAQRINTRTTDRLALLSYQIDNDAWFLIFLRPVETVWFFLQSSQKTSQNCFPRE